MSVVDSFRAELSFLLHHCDSRTSPHYNTDTMSAIQEDDTIEPVKVLITLHECMDAMDVIGPLEVFSWAQHDKKNPGILP